MKLHFSGKYSGNPADLPNQRQVDGAVKFREPSPEKFGIISNLLSLVVIIFVLGIGFLRTGGFSFINSYGLIAAVISLIPHEFLHAICFVGDVYFFTYFEKGLLFVVGDEDMSKGRFVLMSMLPNIVFGFIPFLIFLFFPSASFLASFGGLAISAGTGDYINVYNALTQVPANSKIYMYRMNTYWYSDTLGR